MAWNRHAIAQTQLRGRRRVDGTRRNILISTQALAPRLERAKSTEDDDEGLGLCRLFCEMGEAYLPMIASERDCNQASIVEVLMACTEFPP